MLAHLNLFQMLGPFKIVLKPEPILYTLVKKTFKMTIYVVQDNIMTQVPVISHALNILLVTTCIGFPLPSKFEVVK